MRLGVSLFLMMILTVALLPTTAASGVNYYTATSNDYGTYLYFTSLLSNFSSIYTMILSGGNTTFNASYELYSVVNSTYETTMFYSGIINSKTLSLASYFKTLGECSFDMASGDLEFRRAMKEWDYVSAREALLLMETGLSSCKGALLEISSVKLVGENNESLRINVGNVSSLLDGVGVLIGDYRRALDAAEKPSNFSLFISRESPMVTENLTIFGYAPNMSSVVIMINGTNYTPSFKNGTFNLTYSFQKSGVYEIYAIGINSSGSFRSNVIKVNVTRITTRIIAKEERSGNVTVSGYLLDYWGKGVPNALLSIIVDGRVYSTVTNSRGFFNTTLNVPSEINATILFWGDSYYAPSNMTLLLIPAKLKPSIRLIYKNGVVKAGSLITINGVMNPDVSIPLVIYVDGSPYTTIIARGKFSFSVKLGEGTHEIYAYFMGNREFAASKSNVIQITATPVNYVERFLTLVAFFILAGVGYWLLNRRGKQSVPKPSIGENENRTEAEKAPSNVIDAYRLVYNFLKRFYSLPPSITPRELLSKVRDKPFYSDLAELTLMHERSLYARVMLGLSEVGKALKHASKVIITAIVGDEL